MNQNQISDNFNLFKKGLCIIINPHAFVCISTIKTGLWLSDDLNDLNLGLLS